MQPDPTTDDKGEQKPIDIMSEARANVEAAWNYDQANRREAAIDLQFIAGKQWPDSVLAQRNNNGVNPRPCLVENFLPQYVRQVTNSIRQSVPSIKCVPASDGITDALVDIFEGLIRQIEYQSQARSTYVIAAEHQAMCGIGHFRVVTEIPDDEVINQEIYIRPMTHPQSVLWDPAAVLPDRSDAMWCIVAEPIPVKTFERLYPGKATVSVGLMNTAISGFWWPAKDVVTRAEYWRKVPIKKRIGQTASGEVIDLTHMGEAAAGQLGIMATRIVDTYRVEQYIISGADILAGPHAWAGKHIPIIPVIGAEVPIDNGPYRYGLIRFARDPQQMHNYWRSAVAELLTMQPKAPWLVTADMVAGLETEWSNANTSNKAYLRYRPGEGGERPERIEPPSLPPTLIEQGQMSIDAIKATIGIYDANLGARSNETSGRAIAQRQEQGDVSTYHFIDNLTRSLEHCGRILVDLIPKIYDAQRSLRTVDEKGEHEFVVVNQQTITADGRPLLLNDLGAAKFDVRINIGKSYQSTRLEAADMAINFMQTLGPAVTPLMADIVAKHLDWPGAEEIAERLRRAVPPHLLPPGDPDLPPPPPPPPPQVIAMENAKLAREQANAARADADSVRALADAHKAQVEAHGAHIDVLAQWQNLMNMQQPQNGEPAPPQVPITPPTMPLPSPPGPQAGMPPGQPPVTPPGPMP